MILFFKDFRLGFHISPTSCLYFVDFYPFFIHLCGVLWSVLFTEHFFEIIKIGNELCWTFYHWCPCIKTSCLFAPECPDGVSGCHRMPKGLLIDSLSGQVQVSFCRHIAPFIEPSEYQWLQVSFWMLYAIWSYAVFFYTVWCHFGNLENSD